MNLSSVLVIEQQLKSKCLMISHLSFKIKTSDQLKMISFCLFLSLLKYFSFGQSGDFILNHCF